MMPWPEHIRTTGTQRLIGYARVSTSGQKLDLQLDALSRAGCDEVFRDRGVSGAKASRPGLDAALRSLVEGDVLVVYKLDRLGRSVLHLADLVTRLDTKGVHFCSLTEGINTTTPGGKLVFHVFAAVAEFHRDLIRENTINGQAAARRRGKHIGRPRMMDEAAIIEAHRLLCQEGNSVDATAAHFRVSRSTLLRALDRMGLDLAT
ncbi:MAG: recombinase family protein [Pseudomonadota bacterium]